jgi:hypothetical protein
VRNLIRLMKQHNCNGRLQMLTLVIVMMLSKSRVFMCGCSPERKAG